MLIWITYFSIIQEIQSSNNLRESQVLFLEDLFREWATVKKWWSGELDCRGSLLTENSWRAICRAVVLGAPGCLVHIWRPPGTPDTRGWITGAGPGLTGASRSWPAASFSVTAPCTPVTLESWPPARRQLWTSAPKPDTADLVNGAAWIFEQWWKLLQSLSAVMYKVMY